MNKKIALSSMIIILLLITACGKQDKGNINNDKETKNKVVENQVTNTSSTEKGNDNISRNITEEEGKNIALTHAGAKIDNITRLKINTGYKNRIKVMEVEFDIGNNEFEYYINIETGEIIKFSFEIDNFNNIPLNTSDKFIGLEEAIIIALEKAQVSKEDIRDLNIEFENYDEKIIYEIEFEVGKDEFEIVIDATNGDIIKFEKDR